MMTPDKEQILEWTEGELEGKALQKVEMWADAHPDEAAKIVSELETRFTSFTTIPSEIEPPYADFLNKKIQQRIEREKPNSEGSTSAIKVNVWQRFKWVFAPVAVAAMAVCFALGTKVGKTMVEPVVTENRVLELESEIVYVPSESVSVQQFESDAAKVIVLMGLEPIADNDIAMLSEVAPKDSVRFASAESRDEMWY
jgi:hypothetical protein